MGRMGGVVRMAHAFQMLTVDQADVAVASSDDRSSTYRPHVVASATEHIVDAACVIMLAERAEAKIELVKVFSMVFDEG